MNKIRLLIFNNDRSNRLKPRWRTLNSCVDAIVLVSDTCRSTAACFRP
jgi:hypothetical protein